MNVHLMRVVEQSNNRPLPASQPSAYGTATETNAVGDDADAGGPTASSATTTTVAASSPRKRPLLSDDHHHHCDSSDHRPDPADDIVRHNQQQQQQQQQHRHQRQRTSTFDNQSNVQEAASGMIGLASTTRRFPPHPSPPPAPALLPPCPLPHQRQSDHTVVARGASRYSPVPPATTMTTIAQAATTTTAPVVGLDDNRHNVPSSSSSSSSRIYDSAVRLEVTKCAPSFAEPWRKLPPVSSVGTGAIISWEENAAVAAAAAAAPLVHHHNAEAGGTGTPCGGTDQNNNHDDHHNYNSNRNHSSTYNNSTYNNKTYNAIRILTSARAVQHATHIRASTQSNPLSVGCAVEWISVSMDLALLKLCERKKKNAHPRGGLPFGWIPSDVVVAAAEEEDDLPRLGEGATCAAFFFSKNATTSGGHGTELDTRRGTVAGFHADEGSRYMLRMTLNLSSPAATTTPRRDDGGGGGPVVDDRGRLVGVVGGSPDRDVVPMPAVRLFLDACRGSNGDPTSTSSRAPHAAREGKGGEVSSSQSEQGGGGGGGGGGGRSPSDPRDARRGRRRLNSPEIPTSGVVSGFQSLEGAALRRSLGLSDPDARVGPLDGVRVLGATRLDEEDDDAPRADDVLLSVDGEPIRLDGTVRLAPGRERERVDFRWLVANNGGRRRRRRPGGPARAASGGSSRVAMDAVRGGRRTVLAAPARTVPDEDDDGAAHSYVICGGCVFVPLTRAWLDEKAEGNGRTPSDEEAEELRGLRRCLQEREDRGDRGVVVLSHVLADEANAGYHGVRNAVLASANGRRPIHDLSALMDVLVRGENGPSLEFRCSYAHLDRAKVVICMDSKEVMDSEARIMRNYMIPAWCSNALSPALEKEALGKARRHGAESIGLGNMRALRNAVRETTLVIPKRRPPAAATRPGGEASAVAATRRIMDFSEAHKMQSAPLFAGKYTEGSGWTQVKTKHLSQLCTCGKSTRFYCICSVGQMRCKDCFIKHCRDHAGRKHECTETCPPSCDGGGPERAALLAPGVELVTTKKRKRNNPTQAIQSRCVVCKAKTCYCCSACGFEKEVALCHVSTGRNCLPIHTSEHHSKESKCRGHDH